MDEVIATIGQAQRADGYLHTPVLIRRRNGETDAQPFQDRLHFETYNLGHLLTAACVHHRATGKTNLLEVAVKAADYLGSAFKGPTPALARNAVCPSHYMGVVELYRTTKDPKYLRLAKKFIDMRDLVADGGDDNQDRIPFRRQTRAVGHAVRANYLYAGAADVYTETGDKTLLLPLQKIWENLVQQKMYVTGGCGALYDGASPDGSQDQKQITRVHQAYGREYQLPNSTAHNETCAAVGSVLWNWRMLQITGEARYVDVLELVLYNAALAGVGLDGTTFFYTNTLRQLDTMPVDLHWSRTRRPFISSFCCPPNLARTIAEVSSYVYGWSDKGVWVNLYGGRVLDTRLGDGTRLKLTQKTDYPWDGRVKITIDAAPTKTCSLLLRIPGWAKGPTLSVNGKPGPKPLEPGTYHELRRVWSAGDVLELELPMRAQLLQAHPLVEEARNQAAVRRGPLVYCLESSDLPKGVTVSAVVLPRAIDLKPRFDATLLGGRHGPRRKGRGNLRGGMGQGAVPRAGPGEPAGHRPQANPLLRLGQPRPVGDDRVDAAGEVAPASLGAQVTGRRFEAGRIVLNDRARWCASRWLSLRRRRCIPQPRVAPAHPGAEPTPCQFTPKALDNRTGPPCAIPAG